MGSHHLGRDPAIPTWDPGWDCRDPASIPPDILPGQVQGEIHFAQRKLCYFVVWTSKDVFVLKIAKDEGWSGNISKLTQFYFEHLFPKVVEGQL